MLEIRSQRISWRERERERYYFVFLLSSTRDVESIEWRHKTCTLCLVSSTRRHCHQSDHFVRRRLRIVQPLSKGEMRRFCSSNYKEKNKEDDEDDANNQFAETSTKSSSKNNSPRISFPSQFVQKENCAGTSDWNICHLQWSSLSSDFCQWRNVGFDQNQNLLIWRTRALSLADGLIQRRIFIRRA